MASSILYLDTPVDSFVRFQYDLGTVPVWQIVRS